MFGREFWGIEKMDADEDVTALNDTIVDHYYIAPFDYSYCNRCSQPMYMHLIKRVKVPQDIVDAHTLMAQRYAGFLLGYEIRAEKQGLGRVYPDYDKPWKEPVVFRDDCIFCQRLNDESAEERVSGYQKAIDREVARSYYIRASGSGLSVAPAYWEAVIQLEAPIQPDKITAVRMIDLPLRLKRKLCIEWNHLLLDWMKGENLRYDFDLHEFFPHDAPFPISALVTADAEATDGQDTPVC